MLATIALCVATSAMIRRRQAALRTNHDHSIDMASRRHDDRGNRKKIFSSMPNVGFLSHAAKLANEAAAIGVAPARVEEISRLIWNDRIDARDDRILHRRKY